MRQRDLLLLQSHQLSHHPQHQHEDQTYLTDFQPKQSRCTLCQTPMCSTRRTNLLMSRIRSQPYHFILMICLSTRVQTPSLTSSSPLTISVKKGEKILRGSLHSVRGSIGLGLKTLVYRRITFVYFSIYDRWFMFLLLLFITSVLCFYYSVLYLVCLCLSQCFVAFLCTFKILLLCLKYFTLVPQQDLVPRCIYYGVFCIGCVLDMQLIIMVGLHCIACPDEHFT